MRVLSLRSGGGPRGAHVTFIFLGKAAGWDSGLRPFTDRHVKTRHNNLSEKPKCFDAVGYCTYRASIII